MITKTQADRLKYLIARFEEAVRDEEMAGAMPPVEADAARLAYQRAEAHLTDFINEVTE